MPAPVGASVPAQILALLADGTPRTRGQLADALTVSPHQVADALAALRQRGLVTIAGYAPAEGGRGRSRRALWTRTLPPTP
jgi:predicted ArsR family transcriptional regulator